MTPSRLSSLIREGLAENPDLVLLTGDYLTGETNSLEARHQLVEAFRPLQQWPRAAGRVFACVGNHDYENLVRRCVASSSLVFFPLIRRSHRAGHGQERVRGAENHTVD